MLAEELINPNVNALAFKKTVLLSIVKLIPEPMFPIIVKFAKKLPVPLLFHLISPKELL